MGKIKLKKLRRPLIISLVILVITVVVAILFISPITKYLVEKYDEKYTGRKITMDWALVNPFTGYIHFSGLKIYEYKSDTLFISMSGLTANFSLYKLLSNDIILEKITLNQPLITITKNKTRFNFDDLVTKFSSDTLTDTLKIKEPVHFSMLNVKIRNGHFYYIDKGIPVNFSIKDVDIESEEGWQWNKDEIAAKFSFLSEFGNGGMKGNYAMHLKKLDYKMDVVVSHFDMRVIEQYMKDFSNYGTFRAYLEADINAFGNLKIAEDINLKGQLAINDFHFGKDTTEDYASFDKVIFKINEVNPQKQRYFIDSMALIRPYFKYEQYDNSSNLATMFGQNAKNVAAAKSNPVEFNVIFAIAEYVKKLATNFLHSNYKVNKLGIYNCNLQYNDFSMAEKFSIELNPLTIQADSIYKKNARVNLLFTSAIKPYGDAAIHISINPKDSSDFDINYKFQKVPLSMFNPYITALTSFPMDRGTLEFKGIWNVRNGNIKSDNHLLIVDPRLAQRIKNKDSKWLPMRLVMALVRERANVIDYEIPITGNLNDPKFHWRDIAFDIIKNIFIKPPTTPYRLQVKKIETQIEKSITLKWDMRSSELSSKQENFVEKMADFLAKNPEASINVYPQNYVLKEKEYLLLFEAKKKYYMASNNKTVQSLSEEDIEKITKMSVKDTLFVKYLNNHIKDELVFTVQEKCLRLLGSEIINARFNELNKERTKAFMVYFKERGVEKQIKIAKGKNVIPYNGFSFYKIDYKGQFPDFLIKAYNKMEELDNSEPRKKFIKTRKKLNKLFLPTPKAIKH